MVFKRFRKMVRNVKKKTWYGKRYMSKGGVGRLSKDVQWLKGQLNVERKYQDQHQIRLSTPLNPGYSIMCATSGIAQGSGTTSRTGASVRIKSLHVKGFVEANDTVPVGQRPTGRVRMVIFYDREPLVSGSGVYPTQSDLYSQSYITSPRNYSSLLQKRFKVLRDITFSTNNDNPTKTFDIYIKMNHILKFNPNTSSGADQIEGPIYVLWWQESTFTTTNLMSVSTRVTYIDN